MMAEMFSSRVLDTLPQHPGLFKSPKRENKGPILARMRKNLNVSESEERPEMNYSTLDAAMEQVKLPVEIDAMSVYRAMEHIQDGRHKRGVRYSVALILTLILLGKVAGM